MNWKSHVAYQSIHIVGLNTSMVFTVFIALAGLYQKLLPKDCTFHDLKWPWRHDEGSPVTIFLLRVSILPVTRCLRVFEWCSSKRGAFHFSLIDLHIMEGSQNWPDLKSPIKKFRDTRFIDTGTDVNRWKFQGNRSAGVALENIQTFYEVRSLDVTWWPDLAWPGSEIPTTYAEKMYDKVWAVFW